MEWAVKWLRFNNRGRRLVGTWWLWGWIARARQISTWRSRGCLPVVIEVTASILEIQQKDPFFRDDLGDDASDSEEMLSMMYCMAIVRLLEAISKTSKGVYILLNPFAVNQGRKRETRNKNTEIKAEDEPTPRQGMPRSPIQGSQGYA
ncbi:hypothetical protein RHMOL_Rhmol01G0002800 [Rhododendron molle]|uniref:Uncharacterized protein n=1 Tax=Rhododendron molle TaxID=49168 RepID=A0ACC0PYF4_RHOML|nr:hypothetical protein RHMOL_Rhmol01G0002800 [Rhododendron molle]